MSSLKLTPEEINHLFPIVGVSVYSRHLELHRFSSLRLNRNLVKKKGQINRRLSKRSLNKFACLVGENHVKFFSLLTLTYGQNFPMDGKRVKRDLNLFLTRLRQRWPKVDYFWFLEFQGRGAPHFHLGLSIPAPQRTDGTRQEVASWWALIAEQGDWPYSCVKGRKGKLIQGEGSFTREAVFRQHRRLKVWEDVHHTDGAWRYVITYVSKPYQKEVPKNYRNVGRFWGVSTGITLGDSMRLSCNESDARSFISALGRNMEHYDVLPKIVFHSYDITEMRKKFDNYKPEV